MSRHLRVLTAAGIVDHARRGREHWYALTPQALAEAGTWLDEITDTWRTALETLKRIAEEETRGNDQ